MNLDSVIRKVPDFPKPGVLYYDITSIFLNKEAFDYCLDQMIETYKDEQIDGIIAVESRGFIMGSLYSQKTGTPMVLARKKGKLPGKCIEESYDLEYGSATLEIHVDDLTPGKRWLIVDDLIATGGTVEAVAKMVEKQGSSTAGVFSIIGLPFLNYQAKLPNIKVTTLQDYQGE